MVLKPYSTIELVIFALLSALTMPIGAYSQPQEVKVQCDKAHKAARTLFEGPDTIASRGTVKCGSKVKVLGSPEGHLPSVHVRTADGKEGYLIADALEQKRSKQTKGDKGQALLRALGAAAAGASAGAADAPVQTAKLMIFGGSDHRTYLGCLSCSEYATDSVNNKFGPNGGPYSTTSVWNAYADFGSHYSAEGACNPYASDPPVIVDQNGKYYGRLSMNAHHPEFGMGAQFYDWLDKTVCAQ